MKWIIPCLLLGLLVGYWWRGPSPDRPPVEEPMEEVDGSANSQEAPPSPPQLEVVSEAPQASSVEPPAWFSEMSLEEPKGLQLELVHPQGEPVREAIAIYHEANQWSSEPMEFQRAEWDAESGYVRIPLGEWAVQLQTSDGLSSDWFEALVTREPPGATRRVELRALANVVGTIAWPEDEGDESEIEKAWFDFFRYVSYRRVAPDTPVDRQILARELNAQRADRDGKFSLTLLPGTYLIGAGRSEDRIDLVEKVDLLPGDSTLKLQLPALTEADGVRVRILDQGRVDSIEFSGTWQRPGTSLGTPLSHRRLGDLEFLVLTNERHRGTLRREHAGQLTLEIKVDGLGSREIVVPNEPEPLIELSFGSAGVIKVLVEGAVSEAEELSVMVRREGSGRGSGTRLTNGVVELSPLEYGRYELSLSSRERGDLLSDRHLLTTTVELDRSELVVRMRIPQLSDLRVTPPPGSAGGVVRLERGLIGLDSDEKVLGEGPVTFEKISPGMRVLTWSVPGRGPFSRIVSIPDDRDVALEEWEPNTLMVLSGSGPLNDDDLIVELDEEPLGDLEEAVVKLRARECRSITIIREGQELTLERGEFEAPGVTWIYLER